MADYWGLRDISERMGWRYERTAYRQFLLNAFPIFKRRNSQGRPRWYTNDNLIEKWELGRVHLERERIIAKGGIERARRRGQQKRNLDPEWPENKSKVLHEYGGREE